MGRPPWQHTRELGYEDFLALYEEEPSPDAVTGEVVKTNQGQNWNGSWRLNGGVKQVKRVQRVE